jgi:hypothetical protein
LVDYAGKSKEMMWQSQALQALVEVLDLEDPVVRQNATQALALSLRGCTHISTSDVTFVVFSVCVVS